MQGLATLNTQSRLVEGLNLNNAGYKVGVKPAAIRELQQQLQNSAEHAQQDYDTANAIGSKSYNTLMGELVALETNLEGEQKKNSEGDVIDFAAATTATLRVPSPCLSRGRSFDDSPHAVSNHGKERKGDMEEEVELLRVLKLSGAELCIDVQNMSLISNEIAYLKKSEPEVLEETLEGDRRDNKSLQDFSSSHDCSALSNCSNEVIAQEAVPEEAACSKTHNHTDQSTSEETGKFVKCKDVADECSFDIWVQDEISLSDSFARDPLSACGNKMHESRTMEYEVEKQLTSSSDMHEPENNKHGGDMAEISKPGAYLGSSNGRRQHIDVPDGGEPIYEGEECILESGTSLIEDREPMYEGEVVLAEQVDKSTGDGGDASCKDEISPRQGELIRNFLKNNASQLTVYGLFSLRDGLKERELCVFFRNNHFSTMFKFDGELYILATDQGYLNQPDLVWEKLNEVNGDTLFMTGDFKEFKVESHANTTWDPQNAMAIVCLVESGIELIPVYVLQDYLASIDISANENSSFNSDLQLAIALQQQEFEQQPPRNVQQPTVTGNSRLVTGPQVPSGRGRGSSLSSRQESKSSREKCIVM
ncbi:hypothetical protein RHSIM_Rhsim11G0008000 [Rhododendron simsii]|uniref:MINDY deubiquitinase domain-containing protein n=1 Tax=Rhododendron simsii TaxID=118357 RepID=A0A834GB73_RHOSS|nr:hypothetical protein RHSIM_Rhsim11G0008000 [Rhododendron simsii]